MRAGSSFFSVEHLGPTQEEKEESVLLKVKLDGGGRVEAGSEDAGRLADALGTPSRESREGEFASQW